MYICQEPKPKKDMIQQLKMDFILEPYRGQSTRHTCPHCNKKNQWTKYIDLNTNKTIPNFGKCNKENACGIHISPYDDKEFLKQYHADKKEEEQPRPQVEQLNFLPYEYVQKSLSPDYIKTDNFKMFLISKVGEEKAMEIFNKYLIGSTKTGLTIFWYVDHLQRVRQGQVIEYAEDGHRKKDGVYTSVPAMLKLKGNFKQSLYGEHLLTSQPQKIGLYEAPKTAAIATAYNLGKYDINLSFTSLTGLSSNKLELIKHLLGNKEIYLYNDYTDAARMVNGILPMRKAGNKMDIAGALDESYTPKSKMLEFYKSKVYLIDSPNGLEDQTDRDIADLLTESKAEDLPPTFEELRQGATKKYCDFCEDQQPALLVRQYHNKNICLDCYNIINNQPPPPRQEQPPQEVMPKSWVNGLFEQITAKNDKLLLLIEKFDLVIDYDNLTPVEYVFNKRFKVPKGKEAIKFFETPIFVGKVKDYFIEKFNYFITLEEIEQQVKILENKHNFTFIFNQEKKYFSILPF